MGIFDFLFGKKGDKKSASLEKTDSTKKTSPKKEAITKKDATKRASAKKEAIAKKASLKKKNVTKRAIPKKEATTKKDATKRPSAKKEAIAKKASLKKKNVTKKAIPKKEATTKKDATKRASAKKEAIAKKVDTPSRPDDNYNQALSNFIDTIKKLNNLGVDEFVRQEIIFKGDSLGLELDTIERMIDDTLFERDEKKKENIILSALSRVNIILSGKLDNDNHAKVLFIKYECLYELSKFEESLVYIIEAIKIYEKTNYIYPSRLRLYYEKAIELLFYFKQYEAVIQFSEKSEKLCFNDKYAFVNELEEIISNKAKAFFYLERIDEAFNVIDNAIYLFPEGDPNQYKPYRAIEIRASFKKKIGDQIGYKADMEMSQKWEEKDRLKYDK